MNLNDCHHYSGTVITAIKSAIDNNNPAEVRDAFFMYRDCMIQALEHGHLNVSTKLSEDMYRAIQFDQLIARRLSGVIPPEVFSEIIEHMPPAQSEMYSKKSTDEIHSELLTQHLKKNVMVPSRFVVLADHFCAHGFPKAFAIALKALLSHGDRHEIVNMCEKRSIIWLLREYMKPENIYIDGEYHRPPKAFSRELPRPVLDLLREHHELLAAIHRKLTSYSKEHSLPLETIEAFAEGLPEQSVRTLVQHHANEHDDPRFFVRVRALGLANYPAKDEDLIEYIRTKATSDKRNAYAGRAWGRALCAVMESPVVSADQIISALNVDDTASWRTNEIIHAVEGSLKHTKADPQGIHACTLKKITAVCNHLLEREGHKAWVRTDLLQTPYLPKCVAHHPKLIAECLEIDLGL
ncbi:hypothetical protein DV532_26125 (plasmid) [Pseudomonas sp. Leaf58]|uniref:hypothetical protein n=1 Tax=Pseudomonas sp. Leaf58 TaxID=1736226 RepID=UPI0006FCC805|nr:hypothetical protein [Pseudomonas sp. Leaf58]AYG47766.1 hypothetical protein DV532_26125 [Pseudomonas sp. Leaf58]KQN62668.1 hypothetical protein ASF02_11005 [Pseudomonas sp. Leaf58]